MSENRLSGNQYKKRITRYVLTAYGRRGIQVYDEVALGTSIIGKQRRVDLLIVNPAREQALVLECKYQDSSGTADEKIPYALQDLQSLRVPAVVVYAGTGFSEGVLHLLQSSALAAYCLPPEDMSTAPRRPGEAIDSGTWQLDHVLGVTFGWWDVILGAKRPVVL